MRSPTSSDGSRRRTESILSFSSSVSGSWGGPMADRSGKTSAFPWSRSIKGILLGCSGVLLTTAVAAGDEGPYTSPKVRSVVSDSESDSRSSRLALSALYRRVILAKWWNLVKSGKASYSRWRSGSNTKICRFLKPPRGLSRTPPANRGVFYNHWPARIPDDPIESNVTKIKLWSEKFCWV